MRHALATLTAVVLLLGCGSSSSSSKKPGSSPGGRAACGNAHARTLAATSAARVFLLGHTVYGCASGGSAIYKLGPQGLSCLRIGRIQVLKAAGKLAAYALETCGIDTGATVVSVRRLTDGKLLMSQPAITNAVAVESHQSVDSLVLKPDGAVAWVAVLGSVIGNRHATEVHKVDTHGSVLLDSGPSLLPGPLKLSGSRLSWRHGGGTRSATLR